jgi:hypothetical protein
MKYTLIAEDSWDGSKTTREFEVDALPEVLTEIEMFLRGAGFFFNGNLDFVNDFDEPEWHTEEFDTPQEDMAEWDKVYSKHYFDTERNK